MQNLTKNVLEYQRSGAGLERLVMDLAPRIHRFPRRTLGWDEDACGDFYLYFQPRLRRLIARFRDQGKPFEAYLSSVLHWQLRTFARQRLARERAWRSSLRLDPPGPPECWQEDAAHEQPAQERAALSPQARAGAVSAIAVGASARRNLLFLVLKCCRSLDGARLNLAAHLTGVDPERLQRLCAGLLAGLGPAERRLERLRGRRNRAFVLCRLLEAELASLPDAASAACLRARAERARQRLSATVALIARVRLCPTNRQVAEALGVPKGTVDSGLWWLKRRLSTLYDPDRERSA